jgi:hypothetical protein
MNTAFSHRDSRADVRLLLFMVILLEDSPLGIHNTAGGHDVWILEVGSWKMDDFSVLLRLLSSFLRKCGSFFVPTIFFFDEYFKR